MTIDMYEAYQAHRANARRRGIDFMFTFDEWCAWWLIDNRWANRGRRRDQFVMARRNDKGPYAIDNVYLATQGQNLKDIPPEKRKAMGAKIAATTKLKPNAYAHLRSDVHPRRVAVVTPAGRFVSLTAAAEHHGITLSIMKHRLKTLPGWDRA